MGTINTASQPPTRLETYIPRRGLFGPMEGPVGAGLRSRTRTVDMYAASVLPYEPGRVGNAWTMSISGIEET